LVLPRRMIIFSVSLHGEVSLVYTSLYFVTVGGSLPVFVKDV
jgi:hypothetical protein